MNKFSKIVLGLKALLGQKAPKSAVTDTQLDWDNFCVTSQEQAIWEEMAKELFYCADCKEAGDYHWCRMHECELDVFETCTVCNNDQYTGNKPVPQPFVCGWCQVDDVYFKGLMKTEKAANSQEQAMLLREIQLDHLSAVDALAKGKTVVYRRPTGK